MALSYIHVKQYMTDQPMLCIDIETSQLGVDLLHSFDAFLVYKLTSSTDAVLSLLTNFV